MTKLELETVIHDAYFALNGSQSPMLTRPQQRGELDRCWEVLTEAMNRIPNPIGFADASDEATTTRILE
tara:strand:- start:4703 stop:4909 length:207 start_codon:yes stop_codon:yes gene_type:complete